MTRLTRWAGAILAIGLSLLAPSTRAAAPQALSPDDALRYTQAFAAVD
jgi:hypothetical protein